MWLNKLSVFVLACSVLLAGCANGTGIYGSKSSLASNWEPQQINYKYLSTSWQELFHSTDLDNLISLALNDNPTLAAAQAALREAKENLNAKAGTQKYPEVNANLSALRQKTSPAAAGLSEGKGSIFDLHNASVVVSYALDLFGKGRREMEVLKSQVDYQYYQLEATYLALTSNIVTTAIREASLHEQLSALKDVLTVQEKYLGLLDKKLDLGAVTRSEVLAQRVLVEQSRAQLPAVENDIAKTRNQLCVLVGKMPAQADNLPVFELNSLSGQQEIPVDVSSMIVRQRPDIQAAEALLNAASAGVGVATANLYPQITLSGSYGVQAGSLADLLDVNHIVWNIGAGVLQPVFNGGALNARRRSAVAVYEQSSAYFRQVVLGSFQNVADVLRALESGAVTLEARSLALDAARDSMEMAAKQFEVGAVNYLVLLNAESQYQQSRVAFIQARAARLADTAALVQALGGSWWK